MRTHWLLLLVAISTAVAQTPSFEVASIKPADPSARGLRFSGGPGTDSPGQLVVSNYPLDRLIARAFDKAHTWEVVIPSSVPTDRYDITAKAPPGISREQFFAMTQHLLEQRFGLVAHREIRELPVYELVVAKDGHHLTAVENAPAGEQPRLAVNSLPKDKDGWPILPPDAAGTFTASIPSYQRWMYRAQPLSKLLEYLRFVLDRSVIDKTGLSGIYHYNLSVLKVEMPAAGDSQAMRDADSQVIPNLIAGVERLGLKLASTKGPVEVVVIDRVNKKPTEN